MKMRSICSLVVALMLPVVSQTQADMVPVDVGSMHLVRVQNGGPTYGGEFVWDISGTNTHSQTYQLNVTPMGLGAYGAGTGNFISFCVQTTESVSPGWAYDADLNDNSELTPVPLHNETAWLYRQFVLGSLGGYDYTPGAGRVDSAAALQAAIWELQSQAYAGGSGLTGTQAALKASFLAAAAAAAPTSSNGVFILNVWKFDSTRISDNKRQDMLVFVPLPAPVWMAGIGFVGVVGGAVVRRRSNRGSLAQELSL